MINKERRMATEKIESIGKTQTFDLYCRLSTFNHALRRIFGIFEDL